MASNDSHQPSAQPDDPHRSPSYQSDTPAREAHQSDDPMRAIEDLDKELGGHAPGSGIFWEAHHKLQRICVSRMRLPSSHLLSSNALKVTEHPFTSGGFSDIYTAIYQGRQICVKKLRVASDSDKDKAAKLLCRQALIWKRLEHRNIVQFLGVTADLLQVASEWMPGGNLTTHLNSNPNPNRVALLVDVAGGLNYLHSFGVIHSDLKGPNILLDGSGRACITDFDLAQSSSGEITRAGGQSARWTAPEVLAETEAPSMGADVFSFAMVMIEVFTGKFPYNQRTSVEAMMAIMDGERPEKPTHTSFTDELWKLMQKCWSQEQDERPQISEVLKVLITLLLPPDPIPQRDDSNAKILQQPEVFQSPNEEVDPCTQGHSLSVDALDQSSQSLSFCSEFDRRNQMAGPPEELDSSGEVSGPSEESDTSEGMFDPFAAMFGFFTAENLQLFRELSSIEKLGSHTYTFPRKVLRESIEFLDEALNQIPLTDRSFPQTLRLLQNICGDDGVLPLSYLIPNEKFSNRKASTARGSAHIDEAEFNGKKVCIRNLRSHAPDSGPSISKKEFYRQLVVWKQLRHSNIVPILGVTTNEMSPFEIVCDWMEHGRITRYAREHPEANRVDLLWDVVDGLRFLHSCGIIHGDLKAGNVLIDKGGHARLVGFGLASIIRRNTSDDHPEGRNPVSVATWAAPETVNGGAVTEGGDIFMFGMVVFEVFEGHSMRVEQYQSIVGVGGYHERPKLLVNDWLWEIVGRCWEKDPKIRPGTQGLLDSFQKWHLRERGTQGAHPVSSELPTEAWVVEEETPELLPSPPAGGPQTDSRGNQKSKADSRLGRTKGFLLKQGKRIPRLKKRGKPQA